MALKKKYLKSKAVCKTTFELPKQLVGDAKTVALVGDFNGWEPSANPMKASGNKPFSTTIDLDANASYQFRYLLDGGQWLTDEDADGLAPSPYADARNSLVSV